MELYGEECNDPLENMGVEGNNRDAENIELSIVGLSVVGCVWNPVLSGVV